VIPPLKRSTPEEEAELTALIGKLDEIDVLPQSRLEQLAARGVIIAVQTFDDHMNPQVHWIEPEEYGAAFDKLMGEDTDAAGEIEVGDPAGGRSGGAGRRGDGHGG